MADSPTAQKPTCHACKVDMENGLIPEFTSGLSEETCWQPGPRLQNTSVFRTANFLLDPANSLAIDAWRCPRCGELRLFANRPFSV